MRSLSTIEMVERKEDILDVIAAGALEAQDESEKQSEALGQTKIVLYVVNIAIATIVEAESGNLKTIDIVALPQEKT